MISTFYKIVFSFAVTAKICFYQKRESISVTNLLFIVISRNHERPCLFMFLNSPRDGYACVIIVWILYIEPNHEIRYISACARQVYYISACAWEVSPLASSVNCKWPSWFFHTDRCRSDRSLDCLPVYHLHVPN